MSTTLDVRPDPLFKERKDGVLEYQGSTELNVVLATWQSLDEQIDIDIWSQASIAAAITPKWQKATVETFAQSVEKSFGYIYKIARTYKYYTDPKNCPRVQNLTFKHHTIALRHPNPGAALLRAREKGWSSVKFYEWIREEVGRGRPKRSAMSAIKLSELRAHLEHVEEIIQGDFIDKCPNKDFAVRVFGQWVREVREENKQLYIADIREMVRGAVDDRGARTIKEITSITGIKHHEVLDAVAWLVNTEETHEWVEQGGETDTSRGSNTKILHRVGTPDGKGYNAPRTANYYSN